MTELRHVAQADQVHEAWVDANNAILGGIAQPEIQAALMAAVEASPELFARFEAIALNLEVAQNAYCAFVAEITGKRFYY